MVADEVPQTVVDELEAINVEEQNAELAAAAAGGLLEGALELPHEVVAIGKAGQGIVKGVIEQLTLGLFAGRDVGLRAGHADRPAGLIAHRDTPAQHPAVAAVAVHHAMLALEMAGLPVEMLLQVGSAGGPGRPHARG